MQRTESNRNHAGWALKAMVGGDCDFSHREKEPLEGFLTSYSPLALICQMEILRAPEEMHKQLQGSV